MPLNTWRAILVNELNEHHIDVEVVAQPPTFYCYCFLRLVDRFPHTTLRCNDSREHTRSGREKDVTALCICTLEQLLGKQEPWDTRLGPALGYPPESTSITMLPADKWPLFIPCWTLTGLIPHGPRGEIAFVQREGSGQEMRRVASGGDEILISLRVR